MSVKIIFLGLLISLLLVGCEKSPMEKLASDKDYPEMNSQFWAEQQQNKTALWQQALAYCQKHTKKPNCADVLLDYVLTTIGTRLHSDQAGLKIDKQTIKD